METNINNQNNTNTIKYNSKTIAGLIILTIGSILLLNQLNLFFIPHWLFSWPMWIIAYGLYKGSKYDFKKPFYIWMIVVGAAFLFTENINNADRFIWPAVIIGVGTWLVMKPKKQAAEQYSNNQF